MRQRTASKDSSTRIIQTREWLTMKRLDQRLDSKTGEPEARVPVRTDQSRHFLHAQSGPRNWKPMVSPSTDRKWRPQPASLTANPGKSATERLVDTHQTILDVRCITAMWSPPTNLPPNNLLDYVLKRLYEPPTSLLPSKALIFFVTRLREWAWKIFSISAYYKPRQ